MDLISLAKIFTNRPEMALLVIIIGLVFFGIQRLFSAGFRLLVQHLENIDQNFNSVAKDLGGLRIDVAKVAERLEAREEIVEAKFTDLDRRVTRLEDREERVQ